MLCKILHVYLLEIATPGVQGEKSAVHPLYFQTLHQLTTEMHSGGGSHYRPFVARINTLVALHVELL